MRHFLWIFAVVNVLIFSLGFSSVMFISCCIGALICTVVAYSAGCGKDSTSAKLRIVIASVFTVPLCIVLVWSLMFLTFHWLIPQLKLSVVLAIPFIGAYYIVPSYAGIAYIIVTLGFLGFALYHRTFSFYKRTLSIYIIVVLCFVIYILWWYITGQVWSYL